MIKFNTTAARPGKYKTIACHFLIKLLSQTSSKKNISGAANLVFAGTLTLTAISMTAAAPAFSNTEPDQLADMESLFDNTLVRPHSPILGAEDAPVTIVEFFDPACEACRAFYPLTKRILATYPEQVQLVLRYTSFHGEISDTAIRVLEAARRQDVFEPVLETLLARQEQWASHGRFDEQAILDIASQAGLDQASAEAFLDSPEVQATINQDMDDVRKNKVLQTPTFFINGELLSPFGMQELFDAVKREVEDISEEEVTQ
ncbi:DsbA family protein [Halomonas cupida]|uniref:DsbA family protein n=1 Tax=Halomonas cupida TaxID=44933 RepID=UPI0039B62374